MQQIWIYDGWKKSLVVVDEYCSLMPLFVQCWKLVFMNFNHTGLWLLHSSGPLPWCECEGAQEIRVDLHRQEENLQKKLQHHHDLWFVNINMKSSSPPLPLLEESRWLYSYCHGYGPVQNETPCSFIGTSVSLTVFQGYSVAHLCGGEHDWILPVVLPLIFMVLSS